MIEKPAGLVVNRAESVKEATVQDWVEKTVILKFAPPESDFRRRSGVVHRLDKETSGLLLIAKNAETFQYLQQQFKERQVEKKYLALVHGHLAPAAGEIKVPIARLPWNRERFGPVVTGRPSITRYQALDYLTKNGQELTLVEVFPKTGRTHQIRVHLKYLRHPLVGDSFYLGQKELLLDHQWLPRLFLHASYLRFRRPDGQWLVVTSQLPADLLQALKT